VLKLAYEQGVDLTAKDVGGHTPRDLAELKGRTDTIALIDELLKK
jgi:hypothetical protein